MTVAVLFFANPTVRLFDIFPDFIACFIIARALRYPADRAPFFNEARSAFLKLAIVSLVKIPAFFILIAVRGANVSDYDISVLLTFSFGVIEALYFTSAIGNLFSALFYLGERSGDNILLAPFKTSANEYSRRTMKPETLRLLTLAFTYFKLAAGALPEMLLLSSTTDYGASGGYTIGFLLYPYVLILFVVLTIVFGVVFAKSFNAYIRAIRNGGSFYATLDSLVRDEARIELDKKIKKRTLRQALDLFVLACIFLFTLRFDNLQEINLVPLALYAPMTVYAIIKLWGKGREILASVISGAVFFACALVYQISEFLFLDKYGFDLMVTDEVAKSAYTGTMNSAFAAFISFAAFMICITVALARYSKKVILLPNEPESDRLRRDRYSSIKRRCIIWCVVGTIAVLARFADTVFKYFPDLSIVLSGGGSYEFITTALIPWFGTLVFVLSGIFLGYTIYLVSSIKDDIDVYLK